MRVTFHTLCTIHRSWLVTRWQCASDVSGHLANRNVLERHKHREKGGILHARKTQHQNDKKSLVKHCHNYVLASHFATNVTSKTSLWKHIPQPAQTAVPHFSSQFLYAAFRQTWCSVWCWSVGIEHIFLTFQTSFQRQMLLRNARLKRKIFFTVTAHAVTAHAVTSEVTAAQQK